MSQSEENMFENEWSKLNGPGPQGAGDPEWRALFGEAAETPPSRLWDAIERRLDEEDTVPVIPLWRQARPLSYGIAAAVTLLLVGWWLLRGEKTVDHQRPSMAQVDEPKGKPEAAPQPEGSSPVDASARPAKTTEKGAPSRANQAPAGSATPAPALDWETAIAAGETRSARPNTEGSAGTVSEQALRSTRTMPMSATEPEAPRYQTEAQTLAILDAPRPRLGDELNRATDLKAGQPAGSSRRVLKVDATQLADQPAERSNNGLNILALQSKTTPARRRLALDRIVWYQAPDNVLIERPREMRKEYWTALTFMHMSFNPAASVQTPNLMPAFSASPSVGISRSVSQPTIQNRPQFSVSLQAQTGVKLARHWSLESGLNYLQGRSTAESNAVVVSALSSVSSNLLENAVLNSSANRAADVQSGFVPNDKLSNYAVGTDSKPIANDYQFLQVPVQAGYHIRPGQKLSYALLGGVLANVFLRNNVGSVAVTPSDQVYRPVTLAGTAGFRFQYRPTQHWSGSMTGSYQKALQSGSQTDSQVQIRPQAIGVGFGVNYHF